MGRDDEEEEVEEEEEESHYFDTTFREMAMGGVDDAAFLFH